MSVEVLPVYVAPVSSICLHDMLCGFLGVIKFNIELIVPYFFENIHLPLIPKYFANYLELLLIGILARDML